MSDTHDQSAQSVGTCGSGELFRLGSYRFKLANQPEETEQIHRLLYRTFVLEIGQYPDSGTGYHTDKFHHKNVYLVAMQDGMVKGMLAVHDQPPFSAADALACKEVLERLCPKLLEVRLLAVEREDRGRQVLAGFMWALHQYTADKGYQYLAISGLVERQTMYLRAGFRPLGPPVRRGQAYFVPMLLDLAQLPKRVLRDLDALRRRIRNGRTGALPLGEYE
jgi:N-acyl-L-homoserine lactone synthetase